MVDDAVFDEVLRQLQAAGLWPPVSGVYLPDDGERVVITGRDGFTATEVAHIQEVLAELPYTVLERPTEPGIYY